MKTRYMHVPSNENQMHTCYIQWKQDTHMFYPMNTRYTHALFNENQILTCSSNETQMHTYSIQCIPNAYLEYFPFKLQNNCRFGPDWVVFSKKGLDDNTHDHHKIWNTIAHWFHEFTTDLCTKFTYCLYITFCLKFSYVGSIFPSFNS